MSQKPPPGSCLELRHVLLAALPGAEINECKREALIYALTNRVLVKFEHNGSMYTVYDSDAIHDSVKVK